MIGNASLRPQETNLQVIWGRYSDSDFNISFNSSHSNFKKYINLLYGSAQYVGSQKHFKKYSAFELRGRNRNSDKWVPPRIEFCVVPIFPIFEYSVFEKLIGILDIFFGPARARGSQLGSRRAARRDRVRARYAESRVCRPWFWRCPQRPPGALQARGRRFLWSSGPSGSSPIALEVQGGD